MKCRKVVKIDLYNVVMYGSYGLQNPYAIIFKRVEKDPIGEKELKNDIYVNKCPYQIKDINENLILTITEIDLDNKTLTYEYNSSYQGDAIKLIACYYNSEKSLNDNITNVIREYDCLKTESTLNFEILMMAKRWKDDLSSYAEKQEGTASSLIQRLSVIQGELWYRINYGLPLFQNIRDKGIMDSVIIDIILSHPDVASIRSFSSKIEKDGTYYFENAKIITIFNETIELTKVMG